MKKLLLSSVTTLLLTACATPLHIESGKIVPPPGQGYVIAAVTMDSLDHDNADAGILLNGPRGEIRLESQINLNFIRAPGNEPDGAGKLHVVALPAGHYQVSKVYGSWADDTAGWMRFQIRPSFALNEPFDLQEGEVVYLGDYHMSLNFQPSFSRANTQRRDFNDLAFRRGVTDFSNITIKLPAANTNK